MSAPAKPADIEIPPAGLPGMLTVPEDAAGLVVFAHGSGSSRFSPRNVRVARGLNDCGLGTLLFDLLHPDEAADRRKVFDIPLLAERIELTLDRVRSEGSAAALPIGLFGASTGAAAALTAASRRPLQVGAVVSRGGRPDLAGAALPRVTAPTLLIVGGQDEIVIELNRRALAALACPKRLEIVPGAGHLFEEPGKLERVTALAAAWFAEHLRQSGA
ncbi:MAG TPA: alpha/beta family hydrolase [Hyphomicrobiaceae bacterium]|nr:alpha/beta family hydrolase [Hyphomicrobiaceae bacterium]